MSSRSGIEGQDGEVGSGQGSLKKAKTWRRGGRPQSEITIETILAWADAHHEATGDWPSVASGRVRGVKGESWAALDYDLRMGRRGLAAGSTLARLLADSRPVRNIHTLPRLTIEQVLAWADAHHARTGLWPNGKSGPIPEAPGESWANVTSAISQGMRGLPGGGMTISRLLVKHRGARARQRRRPLTIDQILAWADAYHAAKGRWPIQASGPVAESPGDSWNAITVALTQGDRGLPGGSSLAQLLAEHRGVPNRMRLPHLTVEQIRAWAESYRAAHGRWPTAKSGPVTDSPTPGETWARIDNVLQQGSRGLPGGQTLARLLSTPSSSD